MSHFKMLSGLAFTAAAVILSNPLEGGTINLINNDTFSDVTPYETTYQTQQTLSGTVDSYFTTVDNSLSSCVSGLSCLSNVDIVGNISPVPDFGPTYNLTQYEGICAASGSVDCIDLDGTATGSNENAQGALQATVDVTTAGTVVLSSGILGTSGFLTTGSSGRSISTGVLIVFGNSACFTGETSISAYQSNANCLYVDNVTASNANGNYGQTSGSMSVGVGTYYVEYLSETAGNVGALLTDVNLTETVPDIVTPEPSTMILLGSALIGLGAAGRWRRRKVSA